MKEPIKPDPVKKDLGQQLLPFYLQPHNRFEHTDHSRSITGADPGSYHKLGIAITDSYIENGNLKIQTNVVCRT